MWNASQGRTETYSLSPSDDETTIQKDGSWLGSMVRIWLDEEWAPLECHTVIGHGVSEAYMAARREGNHEMQDVLMCLANDLQNVDYYDSFTDAFTVANKSIELLMLRAGIECGCTSEADRTCIERFEKKLAAEAANN